MTIFICFQLKLLVSFFVITVYEIHLLALSTLPMNRIMHEAGPVDGNWWNPVVINRLQRECNKRQTEIMPNRWILIIFSASLQWYLDIRFRTELGFCYCPFSIFFFGFADVKWIEKDEPNETKFERRKENSIMNEQFSIQLFTSFFFN